jgi:hypothetical protein
MDYEQFWQMNCLLKWLRHLTPAATASWLIVAGFIVYWEFLDDPIPVTVNNVALLPDIPHHPGDTVTLHVDVCQNIPGVPGTGLRMIAGPLIQSGERTGGFMHFLSGNYIDPSAECTKHDRPVELPRDLAPGNYQYVFQGVYQVNPIKQKVFTQKPVPFEIVQ